jgi:hypothetical protein
VDPAGTSRLPSCLTCLIIRLIIQTIRPHPSGPIGIDEAPNLSRADPSGADQTDAEHQATDLAVVVGSVGIGCCRPRPRCEWPWTRCGPSPRSTASVGSWLAAVVLGLADPGGQAAEDDSDGGQGAPGGDDGEARAGQGGHEPDGGAAQDLADGVGLADGRQHGGPHLGGWIMGTIQAA